MKFLHGKSCSMKVKNKKLGFLFFKLKNSETTLFVSRRKKEISDDSFFKEIGVEGSLGFRAYSWETKSLGSISR